jgi:hypothetical protein
MAQRREHFEAELQIAIAEGVLTPDEAAGLLAEACRLERSPLAILRERGKLSDGAFASSPSRSPPALLRRPNTRSSPRARRRPSRSPPPFRCRAGSATST